MRHPRPWTALSLAALLALTACGSDDDSSDSTSAPTPTAGATTPDADATTPASAPADTAGAATPPSDVTVTVAAANFPESQVLAEVYALALEGAGISVERVDPIGSRETYYAAVESNEIQLVPEYTNSLLSFVLRQSDPNAKPEATTIDEQITELDAALPDTLAVGTPSTAEDKDVIVCSKAVADQYSLTDLSSLAAVADQITLGAPPEFEDRSPFGLAGLKDLYGAEFEEFVPLEIGAIADSINSGAIDCGNMFSTMSAITTNDFVPMEDDQHIVAAEAVLPLVNASVATPEVLAALDAVSATLTTDVLKALMVEVEVDKKAPNEVAKEYVDALPAG